MKFKNSYLLISFVLMILAVLSSVLIAYAYYEDIDNFAFVLENGEFEVKAYISFSETPVDLNSEYYDVENNILLINAYDETSENYIGNLKVDIEITANVAARVRIKLLDEWELTRIYTEQTLEDPIDPIVQTIYHTKMVSGYHPFSLLKVGEDYDPIYDVTGYAYLPQILGSGSTTLIHFIDSGDPYLTRETEIYYETCFVSLRFLVEVVQANRFSEIWEMNPNFFD